MQIRPEFFFAMKFREQTDQTLLPMVLPNRKMQIEKCCLPCRVQPFLVAFRNSGSQTNSGTRSTWMYNTLSDHLVSKDRNNAGNFSSISSVLGAWCFIWHYFHCFFKLSTGCWCSSCKHRNWQCSGALDCNYYSDIYYTVNHFTTDHCQLFHWQPTD